MYKGYTLYGENPGIAVNGQIPTHIANILEKMVSEIKTKCLFYKDYDENFTLQIVEDVTTASLEFIKKFKFNIKDMTNIQIERHIYSSDDKISKFAIHQDDFGGVSYKTVTIIYYLFKHPELEGGNLTIYNQNEEYIMDIETNSNTFILMNGDVYHNVSELNFKGNTYVNNIRDCIVIQFERE